MLLDVTTIAQQLHCDRHQRLVDELAVSRQRRWRPRRPVLTLVVAAPAPAPQQDAA